MLQLLLFDLRRRFAPGVRRLRADARRAAAEIPAGLRSDLGLSDARLADLIRAQAAECLARRREEEADRLLAALNCIARRRRFARLRWSARAGS